MDIRAMLPGRIPQRQFPAGDAAVTNGLQPPDWDDGHTRTAPQGALARSPGGAGELLLVALQLLVHAAPQWTWAAAADRVAIERGHGLHFARRGRDQYLVGGAQLRFADRLHAASNG